MLDWISHEVWQYVFWSGSLCFLLWSSGNIYLVNLSKVHDSILYTRVFSPLPLCLWTEWLFSDYSSSKSRESHPRSRWLTHGRIWTPRDRELSISARGQTPSSMIQLYSPKCLSIGWYECLTPLTHRFCPRVSIPISHHPLYRSQWRLPVKTYGRYREESQTNHRENTI